MAAVQKHRAWAAESGEARRRSVAAMRNEIQMLMQERVLRELRERLDKGGLDEVVSRVVDKDLDPYGAVDVLLDKRGD